MSDNPFILFVVLPLAAYAAGSVPFGFIIGKALDVLKGLAPVLATGLWLAHANGAGAAPAAVTMAASAAAQGISLVHQAAWLLVALGAILGHVFTFWLKFRGGKGVATGVGVFIALAPLQVVLVLLGFAIVVTISRYISLGSILASAAFPVLVYYMKHPPLAIVLGAAGGAIIIIARHHANIRRLLTGTESKVGRKKH